MTLWAGFDPGLSTGLAVANEEGIQGYVVINFNKIEDSLLNWDHYWGEKPATVVVEDYRLNPATAKHVEPVQSKLETVQVIGMIKMWCAAYDIEFVEQARMYRPIGYKYWNKKPLAKSNPLNHAYDAGAHLMYWLVQNRKIRVKL